MKHLKRNLAILLAVMLMLLCGGCGDTSSGADDNGAASPAGSSKVKKADDKAASNASDSQQAAGKLKTTVYYPDEDAKKLLPVMITVSENNKYAEAVERLVDGKPPKGAVTIFPAAVKVNSVKVADKTATVDFSKELVKDFGGGSAGEIMLINSLVDTLTEFSEIKAVRISVEGKLIDTLSGHLDLSQPIERNDELIKK